MCHLNSADNYNIFRPNFINPQTDWFGVFADKSLIHDPSIKFNSVQSEGQILHTFQIDCI